MATHDEVLQRLENMQRIVSQMQTLVNLHKQGKLKVGQTWVNFPASLQTVFQSEWMNFKDQLVIEYQALPSFTPLEG